MTRGFRDEDRVERGELCDMELDIVHETDKAWLVKDGRDVKAWLPKSAVERDGKTFTMSLALALEKGFC